MPVLAPRRLQPLPALVVAVALQDHFIGGVAARGARRRALRDVALELRVEQVVPVLRRRHAQALEQARVVDQAVGLEHGADPEALRVLEVDRLGLAQGRGDRVHRRLRQRVRHEQLLLGELVEQRALPAPEDVGVRPALPFDDLAVGDRRAGGDRAGLDRDVPALLGVLRELGERRVGERLRHRGDEDQLVLDLLRLGLRRAEQAGERCCDDPDHDLLSLG